MATMIREFCLSTEDRDYIDSISVMEHFYHSHKRFISRSDWEDLQQDIILETLKLHAKFDSSKAKFNTYVSNSLRGLDYSRISRYAGVKVTRLDFKNNPDLVIEVKGFDEETTSDRKYSSKGVYDEEK